MEYLDIDLNMDKIRCEYPTSCLQSKFYRRTGKDKRSLFEVIDMHLYDRQQKWYHSVTKIARSLRENNNKITQVHLQTYDIVS